MASSYLPKVLMCNRRLLLRTVEARSRTFTSLTPLTPHTTPRPHHTPPHAPLQHTPPHARLQHTPPHAPLHTTLPTATPTATPTQGAATSEEVTSTQPQGQPDRLIQRLVIECQSNERAVLQSFGRFLEMTCSQLELDLRPIEYPVPTKQRMTLLKAIFVHKKHRVQYEMRTYFMSATIAHVTGSTADTLLEWLQRMTPEGVAMHVVEHRLEKFPEPVENMLSKLRQSEAAGPDRTA